MKGRQVVAAAALAVAALGVIWYLSLAPSRGAFVEPGPSELALTATQTGTGTWVRYLVTVKNLGDRAFDGDVLLVNRTDSSARPGAARLPLPGSVPSTVGQLGTAAVPAVAPDSAYQVHLAVPSRHEVTVSILAPPEYGVAEARDRSAQPISAVQVDRIDGIPIAVLSDGDAAANQLAGVEIAGIPLTVFSFDKARSFPNDAALLGAYATVVLDQFDSASLTGTQVRALRDFVGLGGNLVVAAGSSWRRTVLPLPPELTPVRPTVTASASVGQVAALSGRQAELRAPAAKGSPGPGVRTVMSGDGMPLVAESDYGAGQVVQLAFDPAAAPLNSSPVGVDAWSQAVGRGLDKQPGSPPATRAILGLDALPLDLFPPNADSPLPAPWVVGPLLLGYLLLVGPINYLVLRQRLHRPALVWVSTPLISLLFAGSFYLIGSHAQGSLRDDEVQLFKVAPQGAVASFEYNQILFPSRGNHLLEMPAGTLVAPMTLLTYQDLAGTCDRCLVQLAGVRIGEEHVVQGQKPAVTESGVAYGSVRIIGTATVEHRQLGVVTHLAISAGHLKGTVSNAGKGPLRGLAVYSYDGTGYQRVDLPDLAPGATAVVDAAPGAVGASTAAPGASLSAGARSAIIANAVALAALSANSQPVLVGFTELAPTRLTVDGHEPVRLGLAAFEQRLAVESADSMLGQWSRVRLAAASGDAKSGFLDTYDVELPQSTGAFNLAYDSHQYSGIELYDWASGSWRSTPAPTPGTRSAIHIDAAFVHDGLVRLRAKESLVGWGDGLMPQAG